VQEENLRGEKRNSQN